MLTVSEAQNSILTTAKTFGTEVLPLEKSFGRVLAQSITADRDYPPFNRAMMDGYAVQSADFSEKGITTLRVLEHIHAGSVGAQTVVSGTCSKIMTGAPVPSGADAVVRVEDTQTDLGQVYFKVTEVRAGQSIAKLGEDAHTGDALITYPQIITPQVASVLAVTGHAQVMVAKLPSVGIISTGNEVVSVRDAILPHQIRDSNAWVLQSFFHKYAISSTETTLAADDPAVLRQTMAGFLLSKDIILLSGGVSKGDADYVPEVLQSLGVRQVFHRVRIKPGGPLWFGVTADGKAVFGLPGNPVSVQVACKIFIEPYLRACLGLPSLLPSHLPLQTHRTKKTPFDEFFPCQLISSSNAITGIRPARYNGSGDVSATLFSDGIALHPADYEQLTENTPVAFYAW